MNTPDILYRDILAQKQAFLAHADFISVIPDKVAPLVDGRPTVFCGIATSLSSLYSAHCLLAMQRLSSHTLINVCDLLDYSAILTDSQTPLVLVSRSGESAEILRLLEGWPSGRTLIAVTEGESNPLAKRSSLLLSFDAGEQAFQNTLSFTLSQLYALGVIGGLGFPLSHSLKDLVTQAAQAVDEVQKQMEAADAIGHIAASSAGILIEGQGRLTGVVEQYALDFQEIRALAIPVTGGIMRHGVIELTERGDVLTLFLIPNDMTARRKLRLAEELHLAGRPVAVLTNQSSSPIKGIPTLVLPHSHPEIESVIFTLGMQLVHMSYAHHKGLKALSPVLVGKVTRKE